MNLIRHTFLILASLTILTCSELRAQSGKVTGRVHDNETRASLPGAVVQLRPGHGETPTSGQDRAGGRIGRVTNKAGEFDFAEVQPGSYTVSVSYVGYRAFTEKITVAAGRSVTLDVRLVPDVIGLEEVVVTGVASRRQKEVADVAVSRVDVAGLNEFHSYEDLSQVLSGKVAGLRVTPSAGNVGGGIRFDVRSGAGLFGSGQPVIMVDGVRFANNQFGGGVGGQTYSSLADLNPEDIESVEVLKGPAAAALYGTSGSNGVILIKTKRGASNAAPGSYGVQYKMTTGWNEQAAKYTPDMALTYNDANAVFRKGPLMENQVSLGGSSGLFHYFTSFEKRREDGIIRNNTFERNSVRANFGFAPNDMLTMSLSTNYVTSRVSLPQNDNNILGYLGNTLVFGPVDAGGPGSYQLTDSAAVEGIRTSNLTDRFIASAEANFSPMQDLSARALVGFDVYSSRYEQVFPQDLDYTGVGITNGQRYLEDLMYNRVNFDLSANYTWAPADNLRAVSMLGAQGFLQRTRGLSLSKSQYPSVLIRNVGAGAKYESADESFGDVRQAGLFFQQDVSLDERYFFSAGVRNDYASAVGEDAPSIFYPRASAVVRLDRFGLLPASLNFVKLRAAYGESGILPGTLDASGLRWSGVQSGSGTGAVISFIGNPTIKPERIQEIEVGIEAEYDNAYGIEFTYYWQFASNSIVSVLNSPSSGLTASATPMNIGSIDGWGYETRLYARPVRTEDWQVDANLILNYANTNVTSLGGAPPIYSGENAVVEGQPRSAFYTFAVRGAMFNDDGSYAGPSVDTVRSYLGVPVPPHTGSFSLSLRFLKHFTISAMADWGLGGTIHNMNRVFGAFYANSREYNTLATQLDLATGLGITPVSGVDPLTVGSDEYRAAANRFAQLDPNQDGAIGYFEKSDFLRIREVSFRYDATEHLSSLISSSFIRSIGFTFACRNLALFTKYSFPDVEVNYAGSSQSVFRGQDFLTLQNPRVYQAIFSIGF